MEIQSLSITVPTNGCVNKCKFCVSRLHENKYPNSINWSSYPDFKIGKYPHLSYVEKSYYKRLKFARDNKCNTVMLTGIGEALQNKNFLLFFSEINKSLPDPFLCIELQNSGNL